MVSLRSRGRPLHDFALFMLILLTLTSCTKLNYLFEQGVGQIKLQMKARKNEQWLQDPQVSQKIKVKIREIQQYKKFFYRYFDRRPSEIYSKTTLLETSAVTHLVVISRYDQVKATKHCFWPLGCFPYQGFFKEKSAINFQKKWEAKGFYTFKRPVYAYSTLGYFDDTILSSFFNYGKFELAKLVFHELFHTLFFIKNHIDLNENLASYFAQQLAIEFFQDLPQWVEKKREQLQKQQKIKYKIVQLTQSYHHSLTTHPPPSKESADQRLAVFLTETLRPTLKTACQQEGLSSCPLAKRPWNNASLSAYLTYEDKMKSLKQLHHSLGISLKEYFYYIDRRYKNYKGKEKDLENLLFLSKNT